MDLDGRGIGELASLSPMLDRGRLALARDDSYWVGAVERV